MRCSLWSMDPSFFVRASTSDGVIDELLGLSLDFVPHGLAVSKTNIPLRFIRARAEIDEEIPYRIRR